METISDFHKNTLLTDKKVKYTFSFIIIILGGIFYFYDIIDDWASVIIVMLGLTIFGYTYICPNIEFDPKSMEEKYEEFKKFMDRIVEKEDFTDEINIFNSDEIIFKYLNKFNEKHPDKTVDIDFVMYYAEDYCEKNNIKPLI